MSMSYIRQHYKVPAKRGMRIRFLGREEGRIIGSHNAYLRVQMDNGERCTLHPTWEVEYIEHPLQERK